MLNVMLCVLTSVPFVPGPWSPVLEPSASSLGAQLVRAGLGLDALAAAGVTAEAVDDIIEDAWGSDAIAQGELDEADGDYATAKASVDTLRPIVQSGQATEQQVSDLQSAQGDLATAMVAQAAALADILEAGTETLTAGQVTTLTNIKANARWRLPVHFLVITRTEVEWIALRDALAAEKSCAKIGDELDSGVAADLANWRSQSDVAAAKTAHDTNAAAVKAAWVSEVEQ